MNKAQLTDLLAERLQGDRRTAATAIESTVDIIVRAVEAGDNVTITGFGVFERRERAARVARNPRTGDTVNVAPTSVPAFRPGTNFKAVVSGETALTADAPAVRRTVRARVAAPPAQTAPSQATPKTKTRTKDAKPAKSGKAAKKAEKQSAKDPKNSKNSKDAKSAKKKAKSKK